MDGDTLDASNLHRQTLYALQDTGRPKALLAAERLRALNPEVDVRPYVENASRQNLSGIAAGYDVIVDCSDNFTARFLVNDVAVTLGKPAVLASVYQYEGQLQVVTANSACLRCLWPEGTADGTVGNCAQAGVLGPVPGVLGSLQALEVLKVILDIDSPARSSVILVDLRTLESQHLTTKRATNCPAHCLNALQSESGADDDIGISITLPTSDWIVVDVREPNEVAAQPLPGPSVHIPLGQLLDHPEKLADNSKYLCVCARGKRALAASKALRLAGRDAVYLIGGYPG